MQPVVRPATIGGNGPFDPSPSEPRPLMRNEIREYVEGLPVRIIESGGRMVVEARNEGGNNGTRVDLLDLLAWVAENMPELLPCRSGGPPSERDQRGCRS